MVCALIWAVVLLAGSSQAQDMRYGDVMIKRLPGLPEGKSHGYHEYLFELENLSPSRVSDVRLELPGAGLANRSGLDSVSASARLEPGSRERLSILQPDLPIRGQDIGVFIDGRRQPEDFPWSSEHPMGQIKVAGSYSSSLSAMRLLAGRRTDTDRLPDVTEETLPHLPVSFHLLQSDISMESWSHNWLAYSGYDGILLAWNELAVAPSPVARALWAYVEAGGNLMLLEVPEETVEAAFSDDGTHRPPVLAGRVLDPLLTNNDFSHRSPELAWHYHGLGEVLLAKTAPAAFSEEAVERLSQAWVLTRNPWDVNRSSNPGQRRIPVVDSIDIPLRGLFVLVLVFAFLVGPINLWWVSHRDRRLWLLWTVPAASFLACLLVALVAILGEGTRLENRSLSITWLNQEQQTAATLAWSGYYSSLATDGLHFSRHTEVAVLGGGGQRRRIAWGADQGLTDGWLTPRLPAYFIERRHASRRERLEVAWGDGIVRVVNGLGSDLEWLVVADASGRLYASEGLIPAGARVNLIANGETAGGGPEAARDFFSEELPMRIRWAHQNIGKTLGPSSYLASTLQDPFAEQALEDVSLPLHRGLVYGQLETEP